MTFENGRIKVFTPVVFWRFVVAVSILAVVGFFVVRYQHDRIRIRIQHQLDAVRKLKVQQFSSWFEQRKEEARLFSSNASIQNDAARFLSGAVSSSKKLQDSLSPWLASKEIRNIFLYDQQGKLAFIADKKNNDGHDGLHRYSKFINEAPKIVLEDFHMGVSNKNVHLGFWVPLVSSRSEVHGAWLIQIDPYVRLYTLLQEWPLPSATAETLLIRRSRSGNEVEFLNELRHRDGTALKLRFSLEKTSWLPATMAIKGQQGIVEGFDYRKTPVLASIGAIKHTPWFIVSKVDTSEIYRPLYLATLIFGFLAILIVSILIIVTALYWQKRNHRWLVDKIESDRKFKELFANMAEGVVLHQFVFDDAGNAVDYRILEVNPSAEKQIGIDVSKALGALATEFYDVKNAPFLEQYSRTLDGESVQFESYFSPLKKHFKISAYSYHNDYFATVFEDITQRKEMEIALDRERERLFTTLKSIGDGVITTDHDGKIVMINRVAEVLTGWSHREAEGQDLMTVFNIINEYTGESCQNPVQKVLRSGRVVGLANHTLLISKDGSKRAIADSGAPIFDNLGKVIGVVLVFRDVTEEQKMEEHLRNTQRLESLGTLAGGLAHDFNNLLAGLFGYIDLARVACEDKEYEKVSSYLEHSLRVYERTRDLTRQLLTFAKGGKPIKTLRSLMPIIRHASEFVLTGSNVRVDFYLEDDLWPCDIDVHQIGQVIDNLVINAKQAMPMGGVIEVHAENISKGSPKIPVDLDQGRPYVNIRFRDTGVGIQKEFLQKIFDPFFSTKQQGSGLGLATSYSIIKNHDGAFKVKSVLGKGSTFSIFLPALPDGIMQDQIINKSSDRVPESLNVLVMDDEEDLCLIASDVVESIGCSIKTASNGKEALKLVQEGASFDFIILDLTIPGNVGGLEIVDKLRQLAPEATLIASSGYTNSEAMTCPEDYGFDGILPKPYTRSELIGLLGRG